MFPIALLDMITHFGMTDAEFQLEFRRDQHAEDSKALTEYWNAPRRDTQDLRPALRRESDSLQGGGRRGARLLPEGGDDSDEAVRGRY